MRLGIIDLVLITILIAGVILAGIYAAMPSNIKTGKLGLEDQIPGTGWKLTDVRPSSRRATFKNTIIGFDYTADAGERFFAVRLLSVKGFNVEYSVDYKFYKNALVYASAIVTILAGLVASIIILMLRIDRLKEKLLQPTLLITIAYIVVGLPIVFYLVKLVS